jgi:hypothetical protein
VVRHCGKSRGERTRPKIIPLGENSEHWYIAYLSVETGIAPSLLLQETDRMLYTMGMYLRWRASQQR